VLKQLYDAVLRFALGFAYVIHTSSFYFTSTSVVTSMVTSMVTSVVLAMISLLANYFLLNFFFIALPILVRRYC
jgi:hypothetical protein